MKRPLLRALILALAAMCLLCACANDNNPDGSETAETTAAEPAISIDRLAEKYQPAVNGITNTAGTFTDRMTAEQLTEAMKLGRTTQADPLLYNIIKVAGLTRDNITVYSEMNGGMLDAAAIDALFLEGKPMREALRGEYTIMAGDYPYTIYELAALSEADLAALNIPAADLTAFCTTVRAILDSNTAPIDDYVATFVGAHTAQ